MKCVDSEWEMGDLTPNLPKWECCNERPDPMTSMTLDDLMHSSLDAVADPLDKRNECQFFLELIEKEVDSQRFRWVISAFFGAAYSFFEIATRNAYERFNEPNTAEPIANDDALQVIRDYVEVKQVSNKPRRYTTTAKHPLLKKLYKLRHANTHNSPFSIMRTNSDLPEGFHLGYVFGKGKPALAFCREVMNLINEVNRKLQKEF